MPAHQSAADKAPGLSHHGCLQATATLTVDTGPPVVGNYKEVLDCYGPNIKVRSYSDVPVRVKRVLVGTGDHCNPIHCYGCAGVCSCDQPRQQSHLLSVTTAINWKVSSSLSLQPVAVRLARDSRTCADSSA